MAAMLGSRLSAGCFALRAAPARHVASVAAPRVHGHIAPVVLPSSSFLGGSFSSCVRPQPVGSRGALVVMANAKKSLGCTKQGTRRARRRTSGFRTRMQTKSGRRILKLRRAKGRKNLCPASTRSSAGKKQ